MKEKILLLSSFIILLINVINFCFFDAFNIIFYLPTLVFSFWGTLICLLIAVIKLFRNRKKIDFVTLFICVLSVILIFLPAEKIKGTIEFEKHENQRTQIIKDIKNENIDVSNSGIVKLSKEYQNISDNGEIIIYERHEPLIIGFYIYRGLIIDGSELVVYAECEEEELKKKVSYITHIKKMKENWYYISTD